MFNPKKAQSFLKETFETLAVWALIVKGCEFVWKYWGIETPEIIWAYTVATFMAVLYIAMFLCFGRQVVYQLRLDEKAAHCAELERQLMKKRQSSKQPKQH